MRRDSPEKPEITLRRAAMDALARREHSFHELQAKLGEKFPEVDQATLIIPVLERLREEKLQSDERFTEAYVRYRAGRGHGPLKIRLELKEKGVAESLIRRHLHAGRFDWTELAGEALAKKHPRLDPASPQDRQRGYRFLAQRGFDAETIAYALRARSVGKVSE